jgi:hypothetical protein
MWVGYRIPARLHPRHIATASGTHSSTGNLSTYVTPLLLQDHHRLQLRR